MANQNRSSAQRTSAGAVAALAAGWRCYLAGVAISMWRWLASYGACQLAAIISSAG